MTDVKQGADARIVMLAGLVAGPRSARPALWARLCMYFVILVAAFWLRSSIPSGAEIRSGRRIKISTHELDRQVILMGRSRRGKTATASSIVFETARSGIPIVYLDAKKATDLKIALARMAIAQNSKFYSLTKTPKATTPLKASTCGSNK